MKISEDKIFSDVMQSARDSSNALQLATQLLSRFDKFESKFEEFDKKTQRNIEQSTLSVKESIFQDRDRYFEKKDKPILEALEKLDKKFDEINEWKITTDNDIKKAKWGIRAIFVTICSYFGIHIKGV